MPVVAFIPLIAAGIAGGTAIAASRSQSRSAERIASGQLAAADRAGARESDNFDKSILAAQDERDHNRWLQSATAQARQPYLDALAAALGGGFGSYAPQTYEPETYTAAAPFKAPDPRELLNDPGYQFELQQGLEGVERGGISRGTFLTGGTGKELQQYGQGLAATRGGERYQRALGEYSLAESLRASAFDRNQANRFNAAQLNQQGAYQAASLGNQAFGQRLSALGTLAGLAGPTGTYPGTPRTPGVDAPTPAPPAIGDFWTPAPVTPKTGFNDEDQRPWSSALMRRTV